MEYSKALNDNWEHTKKCLEVNKTKSVIKAVYTIVYSHLTYNITCGVTFLLGFTIIYFF